MSTSIVPAAVLVTAAYDGTEHHDRDKHAIGQVYIHTEKDTYTSINPAIPNYNGPDFRHRFQFLHPGMGLSAAEQIVRSAEFQLQLLITHLAMLKAVWDAVGRQPASERDRRENSLLIGRRVLELAYEGLRTNQKEASTGV